ncbi:MAG: methylated-DNA--[protein]-cysteine S-methyltransferase [Vicinamibacterales bacterium]
MDDSPAGSLVLAGNRDGLHVLAFTSGMRPFTIDPTWRPDHENMLGGVRKQLDDYFAGRLRAFKTRLAFEGTPFQRQVWNELCRIPYGETISYLELARRIGNPKGVRAVGLANGANPIAIIVPCHRVIGADGSLTGYGGGLPIKKALLALERGERSLL